MGAVLQLYIKFKDFMKLPLRAHSPQHFALHAFAQWISPPQMLPAKIGFKITNIPKSNDERKKPPMITPFPLTHILKNPAP